MFNQKPLLGTLINWAHPLSKGLIGCWLFNENSGDKVFDLSGNGNLGTFGAGASAPTWEPGRIGPALDFDGGDEIDCGSGSTLDNLTSAITVEAWVKPGLTGSWQTIVEKNWNVAGQSWILEITNSNWFEFYVKTSDGLANAQWTTAVSTGVWYHIVGTFDGTNVKLYVNGLLKESDNLTGTIGINSNPVYIGNKKNLDQFFTGSVGMLKIYNRTLNASEIWQLYIDPYCWLAQPMGAELMYAAPPVGAIIKQFQKTNLGADLYDGVLIA